MFQIRNVKTKTLIRMRYGTAIVAHCVGVSKTATGYVWGYRSPHPVWERHSQTFGEHGLRRLVKLQTVHECGESQSAFSAFLMEAEGARREHRFKMRLPQPGVRNTFAHSVNPTRHQHRFVVRYALSSAVLVLATIRLPVEVMCCKRIRKTKMRSPTRLQAVDQIWATSGNTL